MSRWIVPNRRRAIYARDGLQCVYCGVDLAISGIATLDHVVPRAGGGGNESQNLVTSCLSCNLLKGDRSLVDAASDLALRAREVQVGRVLRGEPIPTAASVLLGAALATDAPAWPAPPSMVVLIDSARERADAAIGACRWW